MQTQATDDKLKNGTPSTPSDDNGADSSQQQQQGDNNADNQSVDDSQQGDGQGDDGQGDGSDSPDGADGQGTDDQQGQSGDDGQQQGGESVVDKEGDEKLRFSSHPRWKELVTEKNENKRLLEENKPLIEQARVTQEFLRDNNISVQEYQSALQYLMLLRQNPEQAYAMMKPTYERLALMAGERLPADLQAEVAAGTLTAERATEIARARAMGDYREWQRQQQQSGQQSTVQSMVVGTIQSWTQSKQTIEPDFKQGSPLWEQVDLRIRSMPPFRNAQEAIDGCNKALAEAKAFLGRMKPVQGQQQQQRRPLRSQNNKSNNQTVVKTPEDVAKAISAGIKPSQLRYS